MSEPNISEVLATAQRIGQQIRVLTAKAADEIDAAFAAAAEQRLVALFVVGDGLFYFQRDQMAALAARYRMASSYPNRVFAEAGGLISYGDYFPRLYPLR
jgi:putative ABC transport system substrate-binding protein